MGGVQVTLILVGPVWTAVTPLGGEATAGEGKKIKKTENGNDGVVYTLHSEAS